MAGVNNFSLAFDPLQFQAVIAQIAATPSEVTKASDRAARHTMAVMRTLIARTLSRETGIPVNKLKTRLSVKSGRSGGSSSWLLFVGLNRMPYENAGAISQNTTGLQHMGRVVKGGFGGPVFGAKKGWIRKKRARELGLALPGLEKGRDNVTLKGGLHHRFPVLRISHDLGGAASAVIMAFENQARAKFIARFEHDLKHIKGLK